MTKLRTCALALLLAVLPAAAPLAFASDLSTVAERSGLIKTGRYSEVQQLCQDFQKQYPKAVRCLQFGKTPEGRPMLALAISRSGALTATAAKKMNLPVTLIQGGIHAGEIDGKDAGFLAIREILDGKLAANSLNLQVLLFVPVFNIDGHERFGHWNRPNQRGPEEMGWRTTAQNFNLNRDYLKADTPEMHAMLTLVNEWDPLATIDLHVTDGAKFEHDVSIQVEPAHAGDAELQKAGAQLRDAVINDLQRQGSLPVPFYMSFTEEDNPASGFADDVSPPRFSHGYFQLRNRFGMLVEAHSWKDYATRVRITHNAIISVLTQVAEHGKAWRRMELEADSRASKLGGEIVPVDYMTSDKSHLIDFRGYAYTRTPSEISGALMTRYDDSQPQIWHVPLHDDIQVSESVRAPNAGYVVPAAQAEWMTQKLQQHGIQFVVLRNSKFEVTVESFRASLAEFEAQSVEGHQRFKIVGEWKADKRDLPAGSIFIPIAQAKARIILAMLEPVAPDSLVSWGYFNNAFEKKEYMESYVAEEVARAQLAADPVLANEFHDKLAHDAKFAADPSARLEFFHRRHASWDERYQLYPVLKLDVSPEDK